MSGRLTGGSAPENGVWPTDDWCMNRSGAIVHGNEEREFTEN